MSDDPTITPDPGDTGAQPNIKEQLECAKLTEELRRLRAKRWKLAAWCASVAPVAAATAAIAIPWALGIFSVKQEKIEIQIANLKELRDPLVTQLRGLSNNLIETSAELTYKKAQVTDQEKLLDELRDNLQKLSETNKILAPLVKRNEQLEERQRMLDDLLSEMVKLSRETSGNLTELVQNADYVRGLWVSLELATKRTFWPEVRQKDLQLTEQLEKAKKIRTAHGAVMLESTNYSNTLKFFRRWNAQTNSTGAN